MMKKLVATGALALAAFGLVSASAANLSIAGAGNWGQGHVQQSDRVDAVCDGNGVDLTLVENGQGQVERASVGNIHRDCNLAQIQVRVFGEQGQIGKTTLKRIGGGDGGRENLVFESPVDAQLILESNVTIADSIQ